jgi:hypothetical protein
MVIKGIQQRLHIYTSRWPEDTTTEQKAEHVTNITNGIHPAVEEVNLQYGSMKAFKVITAFNCYDAIYNVDNWPDNVLVKRFGYSNKNKNFSSRKNINKESQNDENKIDTLTEQFFLNEENNIINPNGAISNMNNIEVV